MFAVLYSTKEKPIHTLLLMKRNPKCRRNNLLSMALIHVFDLKDEIKQLYIMSSSTGGPKLFKRGPAVDISWTSCF